MRFGAVVLTAVLGVGSAARAQCFAGVSRAYADAEVQQTVTGGRLDVPAVAPSLPAGSPAAVSSANAPLTGGGGNIDGEAVLVLAVAAAVALPVIVYAVDEDASVEVRQHHDCPGFHFKLTSGAMSMPANPDLLTPLVGGRLAYTQGAFGVDASVESTLDGRSYGSADLHLLLRPPPKQHLEGALALGVRRVVFGGALRDGIDVALPHHYLLWRTGTSGLSIDVTPGVFLGFRGFDYRLDAGVTVPIGVVSLQLGGRVFSFDQDLRAGAYLGVGLGT